MATGSLHFRQADIPTHVIVEIVQPIRGTTLPPAEGENSPDKLPETVFPVQFIHGLSQRISN